MQEKSNFGDPLSLNQVISTAEEVQSMVKQIIADPGRARCSQVQPGTAKVLHASLTPFLFEVHDKFHYRGRGMSIPRRGVCWAAS